MTMKMKGLLKGLRYISTIFDEEEEEEIQIGGPTDVKHVAHIGYDGPAANSPSWIDNFKGESSGGATNGDQQNADNSEGPSLESHSGRKTDKPKGKHKGDTKRKKKPKSGSSSGTKPAGGAQGANHTKRRAKGKDSKDTYQGSVQEDQKSPLDDVSRGIPAV